MKALIIGTGRMGEIYAKVLKNLNIQIVGIFDKSNKKKNDFIKKFKLPKSVIVKNVNFFLKNNKIDLSIISTTSNVHAKYIKLCAENKIEYIYVEKPLANSVLDCKNSINICKKNKVKLSINHNKIFSEEFKKIQKIVSSKRLGKLIKFSVTAGNIGLAMNAIHYIYLFLEITKSKTNKVSAIFENKNLPSPRGKEFLDKSGQIIIENKNKQFFYISALNKIGYGINVIYNFEKGNVYFDELNSLCIESCRKIKYFNLPTYKYSLPANFNYFFYKKNNLINLTQNALVSFLKNKKIISLDKALECIQILATAYNSNKKNGKALRLEKNNKQKFPWA